MKSSRKSWLQILLLGLLTFGMTLSFIPNVNSQSRSSSLTNRIPARWQFNVPSNLGVPRGREGGATRGCSTRSPHLLLIPESNKVLTASSNPTFYWYLPPNNAAAVEFSLRDAEDRELYNTRYLLGDDSLTPKNSGRIMGLQLPISDSFKGLEIGQEYVWEVVVICELDSPSYQNGAMGVVERVAITNDLRNKLNDASSEEQLSLYIDAKLWYETVNVMINLRRLKPNDPEVEAAWKKLMESVNLSEVVQSDSAI
jgi:hypothetical protein